MWEQISSNRRRSVALTIGIGAILLLIGYLIGFYFFGNGYAGIVIALIIWGIMNLVAVFQGDSILLSISKAKKIRKVDHPRLYNIVEEMQIASGLEKMPDIYIIDDPALNAFATGRDPKRASVAITSGLLGKLNRDELQGVIGHEIAHIKNRDVLLMVMCGILLGSIVMLSWFASRALIFGGAPRSRTSSSSSGGGGGIIIIVAVVLMIIAPLAAQLIYFAISRKREYLADASSALYTRYPEGLASALEKLAASTDELRSANKATAPMFIINPFRKKGRPASDLTSTHPPISERIRILRSMTGASFSEYEEAYDKLHHSFRQRFLPGSALTQAQTVEIRAPRPEPVEPLKASIERRRETSEALWQIHDYKTLTCECGTRLRIPPKLQNSAVRCPHCGRINST
jgi:heat shock protein HtpX